MTTFLRNTITQELYENAIEEVSEMLEFVLYRFKTSQFKTRTMCENAVEEVPLLFGSIPNHLKTPKMCEKAVKRWYWVLEFVPDHLKTQKMCENAVEEVPGLLLPFLPDWFVTPKMLALWTPLAEDGGGGYEANFQECLTDIGIEKLKERKSRTPWHL